METEDPKAPITATLTATAVELEGDEASELIASLRAGNQLFSALEGTGNYHLVVMNLTTAGKASQHLGATRYKLNPAGLNAALATLISKPVHITSNFDGHFEEGRDPKAIGVFLGADVIPNDDGSAVVRAISTLWQQDYARSVAFIKQNKAKLGASYEITYMPEDTHMDEPGVLTIDKFVFTGAAILKKAAAAHPETSVLVASQRPLQANPQQPSRTERRTPSAGRRNMAKRLYAGVPEEHHDAVDAAVEAEREKFTTQGEMGRLKAENDVLKAENDKLKAGAEKGQSDLAASVSSAAEAKTAADAKIAELEAAKTAAEAEATAAKEAHAAAQAQLDKIAFDQKVETEWVAFAAKHEMKAELKAEKLPLLAKQLAGKEPLSMEEMEKLFAGKGSAKPAPTPAAAGARPTPTPLYAGGGDPDQMSRGQVEEQFSFMKRLPKDQAQA